MSGVPGTPQLVVTSSVRTHVSIVYVFAMLQLP
jgi:hypothetical protein